MAPKYINWRTSDELLLFLIRLGRLIHCAQNWSKQIHISSWFDLVLFVVKSLRDTKRYKFPYRIEGQKSQCLRNSMKMLRWAELSVCVCVSVFLSVTLRPTTKLIHIVMLRFIIQCCAHCTQMWVGSSHKQTKSISMVLGVERMNAL